MATCACNDWLTAYFIDPKRGQLAMDAINILANFEGVSVHDGLASYGKYNSTMLFAMPIICGNYDSFSNAMSKTGQVR